MMRDEEFEAVEEVDLDDLSLPFSDSLRFKLRILRFDARYSGVGDKSCASHTEENEPSPSARVSRTVVIRETGVSEAVGDGVESYPADEEGRESGEDGFERIMVPGTGSSTASSSHIITASSSASSRLSSF